MSRVEGKVAIITGAASGLGYAAAVKLMSEGAKVMLSDINEEMLSTMPERLKDFSQTQFGTFVHDVTNEQAWIDLIEKTENEFGKINILINSAGISLGADIVSTEFDVWKKVHQVNLDSVFLGCKYAIPVMSKSGQGSIINISSISGIVAGWNTAAYNSSKAGVRLLSKSVALYCAKKGYDVRCNSVHPGSINTPMVQNAVKQLMNIDLDDSTEKKRKAMGIGEPRDVAHMVVYLLSEDSKHVNGTELVIDNADTVV